jgi:hypothetical protein
MIIIMIITIYIYRDNDNTHGVLWGAVSEDSSASPKQSPAVVAGQAMSRGSVDGVRAEAFRGIRLFRGKNMGISMVYPLNIW